MSIYEVFRIILKKKILALFSEVDDAKPSSDKTESSVNSTENPTKPTAQSSTSKDNPSTNLEKTENQSTASGKPAEKAEAHSADSWFTSWGVGNISKMVESTVSWNTQSEFISN